MPNRFAWYYKNSSSLEPKTHHLRSCPVCVEYGIKAGHSLPFRKTNKRYFKGIKLMLLKERVNAFRNKRFLSYG